MQGRGAHGDTHHRYARDGQSRFRTRPFQGFSPFLAKVPFAERSGSRQPSSEWAASPGLPWGGMRDGEGVGAKGNAAAPLCRDASISPWPAGCTLRPATLAHGQQENPGGASCSAKVSLCHRRPMGPCQRAAPGSWHLPFAAPAVPTPASRGSRVPREPDRGRWACPSQRLYGFVGFSYRSLASLLVNWFSPPCLINEQRSFGILPPSFPCPTPLASPALARHHYTTELASAGLVKLSTTSGRSMPASAAHRASSVAPSLADQSERRV